MKKLILLFVLAFIIQAIAFSQPCLPQGITFSTQEEIDNFQTNNPNCTEIEGDVFISGVDISNLDGLNCLTSIGGKLEIDHNILLSSITGLGNVSSIGGRLWIGSNHILTSLTGLNALTSIGGDLRIQVNLALTNLSGLESLTTIDGALYLDQNNSLENLTGLESLTNIGNDIHVVLHDSLINLVGLEGLTSISANLYIWGNTSLTSLNGLDNLIELGGGIYIGFPQMCIGNPVLTSLTGLENINAGSINELLIGYNASLAECEVQCICDYLAMPGADVSIGNNAPGCNSQIEVEEACEAVGLENNINNVFSIYPNPATDKLHLINNNGLKIETVIIYNQLGQIVFYRNKIRESIDISTLRQGIYIIELTSSELKIRQKLIIGK